MKGYTIHDNMLQARRLDSILTKEFFEEEYFNKKKEFRQIAEEVNCHRKTARERFKKFGFKLRPPYYGTPQKEELNNNWKGDKAGYKALHYRVNNARGRTKKCEVCGTTNPKKQYEWANLTGNYIDIYDYKRMCQSCHMKYDGKVVGTKQTRQV